MITHHMRLHTDPFEKISSGSKIIEIRLNDEKRQSISIGDEIEFVSEKDSEKTVRVHVTGLQVFPSFKELFYAFPPQEYGGSNPQEYTEMYKYYSKEEEARYGVLAIRFSMAR